MILRQLVSTHVLSALAIIHSCSWAFAQPPSDPEGDSIPPDIAAQSDTSPADQPSTTGDEEISPRTLVEQSIYIPYAKLREVFEVEGRGVFLPYEQFQELWRAARASQNQPPEQGPPVAAVITEIESQAVVAGDVVRVEAELLIEALSEGWTTVPIRLQDTSILSATLDGEPARITHDPEIGYQLLLHTEKVETKPLKLSLVYAKAFQRTPGRHTVSFAAPQAPVNRWTIRVPQPGVKIDIRPLIAATEVTAGDEADSNEQGGDAEQNDSTLMAFVGAAPTVEINWTPVSAGASGLEALTTVTTQQEVTFDEGLIRTQVNLSYQIERAELAELVIEVPSEHKVVNVFDANVRAWEVETQEGAQRVRVQLFEPIRGTQPLIIELEHYTSDSERTEVAVPVIRATSVVRQHGVVSVRAAEGLRVEVVRRQGILQLDATQNSVASQRSAAQLAYRFASVPFELVLAVEKLQPRIRVEEYVAAEVSPHHLMVELAAAFHIEQAGVFQLRFKIPPEFEHPNVFGASIGSPESSPAEVDEFDLQDDGTLIVNLSRKAIGDVGIRVSVHRALNDAKLTKPTGMASEVEIQIPRVEPASVERSSGWLVVHAPESLQVNPSGTENLREIPLHEPEEHWNQTPPTGSSKSRRVLAFAFNERPPTLTVSAERRQPHIDAAQLLVAKIDIGVIKYSANVKYKIRYSGVDSVRIDIPESLVGQIRNVSKGLREQTINPPPEDLPEGYVAWRIRGNSELLGQHEVLLEWEQPIDRLEVGSSIDLAVPVLLPMDVDRAWGQIVVTKAESLDVTPAQVPVGLRPIDATHDLMPGESVVNAAAAFEFHDRWSLVLRATQYEPQPLANSSIDRSVVRMVVTRGGQIAVQALYRLRSRQQRLAIKLPLDAKFDTQPLKINGRTSMLEQGGGDMYYVPLVGFDTENPVLVELRFMVEGTENHLNLPEFPDDSAVLKTYLCVHTPEEAALLGYEGPWTDEMRWQLTDRLDWSPHPRQSEAELVRDWLAAGIPLEGDPLESFPTDGQLYLFSALQPSALADGGLQMKTMDDRGLKFGVLAVIALLGLTMLKRPFAHRVAVLALFAVACIVLGIFLPIFSRQVVDGVLLIALVVILLVWFAHYLLRQRPRQWTTAMASAAAVVGLQGGTPSTSAEEATFSQPPIPPVSAQDETPPMDTEQDQNEGNGDNPPEDAADDETQQRGRDNA